MKILPHRPAPRLTLFFFAVWLFAGPAVPQESLKVKPSGRTVVAEVVALNQPFMVNRLGSSVPGGQIFALRRDVKMIDAKKRTDGRTDNNLPSFEEIAANSAPYVGNVTLKDYKRPRPIALRANLGDVLEIRFINLLAPPASAATPTPTPSVFAGCHVMGLNLLPALPASTNSANPPPLASDSSFVGKNTNSFANSQAKNATKVYRYFAGAEGVFILSSAADPTSQNEVGAGLFGSVTIQPPEAEYYRSQTTREDLFYATLYSANLPQNMRLSETDKKNGEGRKIFNLTTYESSQRQHTIANVEVVIKQRVDQLGLKAQATPAPAPATVQANDFVRELVLSKQIDPEKPNWPAGYLYSAEFGHPIIDYSIAYVPDYHQGEEGDARAGGSPILRMLYPVARGFVKNAAKDLFFRLPGGESDYKRQIEQLDTSILPEGLRALLEQNWGVAFTDETRVAPERSYLPDLPTADLDTIKKQVPSAQFPGLSSIWLLTGVNYKGNDRASILIQGNVDPQGIARLFFLETELQLFHSDPMAIITGPQAGRFRYSENSPSFYETPASPDRRQPYREFALAYHNTNSVIQAFPQQRSPSPLQQVNGNGTDAMGINYGIAAIGTEILANRLGVGPMGVNGDEADLKFEEFFLSAWACGDPAMVVDRPANTPDPPVPPNAAVAFKTTPPPSQWVQANGGTGTKPPAKGRATKVFFPDDPSNVYHSYMRDHVKMRIYNAGINAPHVHHLHAHQWTRSPNSDEGQYLDSELITPGSAFSLEMVYNGSGNRNQTVGDSIFHCHFYPHFAKGMWALWRVHDVFEEGTLLDANGKVAESQPSAADADPDLNAHLSWVRALPDGEIHNGTPIPAVIPLPSLGIAPAPARVRVAGIPQIPPQPAGGAGTVADLKAWVPNLEGDQSKGRTIAVQPEYVFERDDQGNILRAKDTHKFIYKLDENKQTMVYLNKNGTPIYKNPGFPFFVPGVAGHRPPHPPLDMGWEEDNGVPILENGKTKYLDGGLPRHVVLGGKIVREFHTKWDFTKDFIRYKTDSPAEANEENAVDGALVAYVLPEEGTPIEKAAMFAHAIRTHRTSQPDGTAGNFIHNGLPPTHGAPFADPGIDDNGNAVNELRRYRVAVIQKDVVLNKQGWHYPQQRMLTLWQDVKPTFDEKRPPQPFFFRANGGETVEYWHTNLVPDYYELDDFQVRTPTDIIGQHIHLVKFDVTSSDGAENGFNYEDGTYSPDEVRGRIFALTRPWADGSYRKLNGKPIKERKYDLFAFKDDPKGTVGIDWSQWAQPDKASEPTKWNGSYLQWQMSQEKRPLKGDPPNPITAAFLYPEPPPTQNWDGAMTTIQRFSTDPLLNNEGHDRTVRTVFTHDHFGPSTHQQIGLYGGLLVEPPNSRWLDPVTGGFYYDTVTRTDGGPTGWESIVEMPNPADSYREFALEFQDLQLSYTNASRPKEGPIWSEEKNVTGNPALFITSNFSPASPAISQNLAADFANNGITLSSSATVKKEGTDRWSVVDPVNYAYGAPGARERSFAIVTPTPAASPAASPGASPTPTPSFYVVTPNLNTWADPGNAVAPPQPKLSPPIISNGGGTYSLNYRNELLNNKGAINAIQQRRNSFPSTVTDDSFDFASVQRDKPHTKLFDTQVPPPSPVFPPPWVPQPSPSGTPNVKNGVPPPPLFNRPLDPAKVNGPWLDPVGVAQGTGTGGDGTGVNAGQISTYDPYTPLLRAYQNDRVQVRSLVGAHTGVHSFMIQGLKWLFEPSNNEAGYRNAQPMGLSEHFEMIFRMPPATTGGNGRNFADYLYAPSSGTTGLSNGVWGLMRSFDVDAPLKTVPQPPDSSAKAKQSLYPLPKTANARPVSAHPPTKFSYPDLDKTDLPWVEFFIEAIPRTIVFNDRVTPTPTATPAGTPVPTPTPPILYVLKKFRVHAEGAGKPTDHTPEKSATGDDPLILRVKAGSWIIVTLTNSIPSNYPNASSTIGLHPQLLAFDMNGSNGANIGFNNNQTVPPPSPTPTPGASGSPTPASTATPATYYWYAGDFEYDRTTGDLLVDPTTKVPRGQPSELGAINLVGSDPFNQEPNGLAGALIVEPENVWLEDSDYFGASAAIHATDNSSGVPKKGGFLFQECVVIEQIDLQNVKNFRTGATINAGVNNRTEDFSLRTTVPTSAIFSNSSGGGADPKTPVFTAPAGKPVRFRVLMPGADTNPTVVFELHGHSWREEPFVDRSRKLGDNAKSQVFGSQMLVPHQGLNLLIDRAGGPDGTPGDYLFSNYLARTGGTGAWGILRVVRPEKEK